MFVPNPLLPQLKNPEVSHTPSNIAPREDEKPTSSNCIVLLKLIFSQRPTEVDWSEVALVDVYQK